MISDPQELVDAALAASSADGCVVLVQDHTETNVRWAANSLTTNGQMQTRAVTVVSTFEDADGTRAGVVTRSITSPDEAADLVRAAEHAGRNEPPADDPAPLVRDYDHDDDWSAPAVATSAAVFEEFAPELGAAFERWRKAERLLYGFAEHHLTSTFLGTSTGLRRRFDQPDGRVEINGKSADLTRSAYASQHTRDFTDVDPSALVEELDRRLDWAATRIELPAGRYETLLPPTAVADLLVYMYWNASARDAEEGRNVFAGRDGSRIGDRLAPLPLRLYSDPSYPGLECPTFQIVPSAEGSLLSVFDNGSPLRAVDWIADGTLRNLIRPRGRALATGTEACAAVDNLVLSADGAGPSLEEMIASTARGLLVTCLWYIREVDPQTLLLTGLTRDGVYLVEDGTVRGAVNNFRFNESPVALLGRATEVGRTERAMSREWNDYFRRTAMPTLRIPDFNMSTVSKAL